MELIFLNLGISTETTSCLFRSQKYSHIKGSHDCSISTHASSRQNRTESLSFEISHICPIPSLSLYFFLVLFTFYLIFFIYLIYRPQFLLPPLLHQVQAKQPSLGIGFLKASSSTRDKYWSHFQEPLKQTKLHNCYTHAQSLGQLRICEFPAAWICCLCGFLLNTGFEEGLQKAYSFLFSLENRALRMKTFENNYQKGIE